MPSAKQNKQIHALAAQAFPGENGKVNDQAYRKFMKTEFGVESSLFLDEDSAGAFIEMLKKMVPQQEQAKPEPARAPEKYHGAGVPGSQQRLSQAQANRIAALEGLLGWDTNRTRGMIKRTVGQEKAVEWLMKYEASKLIMALQAIAAEQLNMDVKALNNTTTSGIRALAEKSRTRDAEN